jgi:alkanesulfonate monooxygenase SsuD/methylene tetrahydromethanopterin reductase-like flavin-dependent oxidoreductase (luciferase family)
MGQRRDTIANPSEVVVRIGIQLAQAGRQATPAAVRTSAFAAEALGYHSVWVLDRMTVPTEPRSRYPGTADGAVPEEQRASLDPLVVLAFAAAVGSWLITDA